MISRLPGPSGVDNRVTFYLQSVVYALTFEWCNGAVLSHLT